MAAMREYSGRSFERFVNFTDAIVAIAITLLVLPLLDIDGPKGSETVWNVLADNFGQTFSFALAFALVAQNWLVHNRVFSSMRAFNLPVFWLNAIWLGAIVLLPWATSMYGSADQWDSSGEGFGGTGLFFFGLLAVMSLAVGVVSAYVVTRPALIDRELEPERSAERRAGIFRSVLFTITFLLVGISTVYFPGVGGYFAILVLPIGIFLGRKARRRNEHADAADHEQ